MEFLKLESTYFMESPDMWKAKQTTKQLLEFIKIFKSCLLFPPAPELAFHAPMSLSSS